VGEGKRRETGKKRSSGNRTVEIGSRGAGERRRSRATRKKACSSGAKLVTDLAFEHVNNVIGKLIEEEIGNSDQEEQEEDV
jgi:hypothetical protein